MIRIAPYAFYSLSVFLLAVSLYVHALPVAYGDKIFQLLYASMWLEGKRLYIDIIPVSPPLIFWLYALPNKLAQFGLPDLHSLWLLGLCMLGFSLFLSMRLIALHPAFAVSHHRRIEFLILFCFVLIFRTNPHYFLDREHLFFAFIFPFLLRQMPSLSRAPLPKWLSVIISIMAGIGFCFRPQSLLVLAGIILYAMIRERSWRKAIAAENAIVYLTGIAYLFCVYFLYPEYFRTIVPMALATYSATRDQTPVWNYASNAASILIPTLLMFRPRYATPFRQDIYYLLWLCPFFFLFALTSNNWAYTYYPLGSMALIVTGFVLWEFFYLYAEHRRQNLPVWPYLIGIFSCVGTILFRIWVSLMVFQGLIFYGCYDTPLCKNDTPFLAEVKTQAPTSPLTFGSISIDYSRWTHLSRYSGAQWQTRFSQLWMLPKLLTADESFLNAHGWILNYVGKSFAEDLDNRKPEIMFVDDTNVFYTAFKHVDLVEYLSAVPEFQNAWKHYTFLHSIDICGPHGQQYKIKCKYDVYKRIH